MIKFFSDLRHVGDFLRVLRVPPPIKYQNPNLFVRVYKQTKWRPMGKISFTCFAGSANEFYKLRHFTDTVSYRRQT